MATGAPLILVCRLGRTGTFSRVLWQLRNVLEDEYGVSLRQKMGRLARKIGLTIRTVAQRVELVLVNQQPALAKPVAPERVCTAANVARDVITNFVEINVRQMRKTDRAHQSPCRDLNDLPALRSSNRWRSDSES